MRTSSPEARNTSASELNIQCEQDPVEREQCLSPLIGLSVQPDLHSGLNIEPKPVPEMFPTETESLVVPKEEICVEEVKVCEDAEESTDNVKCVIFSSSAGENTEEETLELDVDISRGNCENTTFCLASSSEEKQVQGVEDKSSASEQTVSLTENLLSDNQSVEKREPEDVPETFSTETECLLDPKEEISVEEMNGDDMEESTDVIGFTFTLSDSESAKQGISEPNVKNREKREVLRENSVVAMKSATPVTSCCSSATAAQNTSFPDIKEESRLGVIGPSCGTNLVNIKDKMCVEVTSIARREKDIPAVTGDIHDFQNANLISDAVTADAAFRSAVVLQPTTARASPGRPPHAAAARAGHASTAEASSVADEAPEPSLPARHESALCGKAFGSASDLVRHVPCHTGARPFVCAVCGQSFSRKYNLKKHETVHTDDCPFVCAVCGRAFALKAILENHQRVHTGERPFACATCGKTFSQSSNLQRHQRVHTGERPYVCVTCGQTFSDCTTLQRHQSRHTRERPFACVTCGQAFLRRGTLHMHQQVHTGERLFVCTVCNKGFSRKTNLKQHMRVHTGERPFVCAACGKAFALKAELQNHQRVHTGERPFACAECGRAFSRKAKLKDHQRMHSDERPFECATCGKTFSHGGNLYKHQRLHTGERPFACAVCGKTFSDSSKLRLHHRVHSGERPFECATCGKTFSVSCSFQRHQRLHTGERPFVCVTCGKGFSQKGSLRRHLHVHTGSASSGLSSLRKSSLGTAHC